MNYTSKIYKLFFLFFVMVVVCFFNILPSEAKGKSVAEFEKSAFDTNIYYMDTFTKDICVAAKDVNSTGFQPVAKYSACGLFDVDQKNVLYANNIHKRIYPASLTKNLTAYVALKHGKLDDKITIQKSEVDFPSDTQVCGLKAGDVVTLRDLLNGLILYSGADCAVAIADHISGSVSAFVKLMNEEAAALGASNSHFVTASGLHNDNHYTTAYDMYLIFNECVKNKDYLNIISQKSYTANVTEASGTTRKEKWEATNFYSAGKVPAPKDVTVVGGKTGYTGEAGYCLILYTKKAGKPYISIIVNSSDKPDLYKNMTGLLESIK